jgi:hypothetical protein
MSNFLVSGLVPIDDETWAIYGAIPVDGQVIVAEFSNRADAETALKGIAADQELLTLQKLSTPHHKAETRMKIVAKLVVHGRHLLRLHPGAQMGPTATKTDDADDWQDDRVVGRAGWYY